MEFKTQVDDGIAFLDRNFSDWRDTVDPEILDVASLCNCPLGQLFDGSFSEATRKLGLTMEQDIALGFEVDVANLTPATMPKAYDALSAEWKRRLVEDNS